MALPPLALLAGYSVAIIAASLAGGWIEDTFRPTHTRKQIAISFVAGLVLGVALFHLLPHALRTIPGPGAVESAVFWTTVGMVLMVLLLRVFQFHHHEFGVEGPGHPGGHARADGAGGPLPWLGVALGMGLHTLTEGAALGASVRGGAAIEGTAGLASAGIFLAILLHKPLDALSVLGTMRAAGIGSRVATAANVGLALACPLGAFLTYWGAALLGPSEPEVVGRTLALAAGALLCVALSDLLPEVQFHGHDRALLTLWFLLGIGLAYGVQYVEGAATHGAPL